MTVGKTEKVTVEGLAQKPLFLRPSQVLDILGVMHDGQEFTVTFQKRDGSMRQLRCSINRKKKETDKPNLVWDLDDMRVKSFRDDHVVSISVP